MPEKMVRINLNITAEQKKHRALWLFDGAPSLQ